MKSHMLLSRILVSLFIIVLGVSQSVNSFELKTPKIKKPSIINKAQKGAQKGLDSALDITGKSPVPLIDTGLITKGWPGKYCGSGVTNITPDAWGIIEGVKADFTSACKKHDQCYKEQLGRKYCDDTFRGNILKECDRVFKKNALYTPIHIECKALANVYHKSVRALGADAY